MLLFQGGVYGLAVLNRPARCLCSGVMCLSWPGDFLLPEALKVITVEEDLSSACLKFPTTFCAANTPRDHSESSRELTEESIISSLFLKKTVNFKCDLRLQSCMKTV